MSHNIPDYFPDPRVETINLRNAGFPKTLPPHIPLLPELGERLVRASGPVADAIARRAIREGEEWKVDCGLSISIYNPGPSNGVFVVVIEEKADEGPLRDYYQCDAEDIPAYAASVMADRPDENPDEQWFISVVNDPDIARGLEENGVGEFSRAVCEMIDKIPPEMACYGMPDSVQESDVPVSELFETKIDPD